MPSSHTIPRALVPPKRRDPPVPRVRRRAAVRADFAFLAAALAFLAAALFCWDRLVVPWLPDTAWLRLPLVLAALSGGSIVLFASLRLRRERRRSAALDDRLQALSDISTDAVICCTAGGRIVSFNPAAERLLGWSADEVVGQPLTVLMPRRVHAAFRERMGFIALTGETGGLGGGMEVEALTRAGREIPVEVHLASWQDEDGPGFAGVLRDLDERARVEAQLRLSDQLLQQLPESIVLTDPDGRIVRWMGQSSHVFGYDSTQIVGSAIVDLLSPEYRSSLRPGDLQRIRLGRHASELPCVRRDGTPVFVATSACPVRDDRGRARYMVHIFRDVGERKRAEELLRLSEQRYRVLIESANDVIATLSARGLYTSINPAFESLLGWRRHEWIGRHFSGLIHPEDLSVSETAFATALRGDAPPPTVVRVRTSSGAWRFFESTRRPMLSGGKVLGVMSIARDVTERRRADQELRQAHAELENRVRERTLDLNQANELLRHEAEERKRVAAELARRSQELERSNADLEQFAYVASHDLQEPLRMVTNYVQLLQEKYGARLDPEADEYIGFAVDGARRMRRLITGLLDYSRRGCRDQAPQPVRAGDALDEALLNLRPRLEETGAQVTSDELPVLLVDPTQLTELFQNLVSNAVKYRGAAPPRVHVSAWRGDAGCVISVRDNGIGIEPRHLPRIFLPFQRGHGSQFCEGAGIGLAICKKIVERNGGRIWVESEPGKGSNFLFTLPVDTEGRQG
ncbi:MAG: PAS domain S-box protein [Planctomycetes bacterium]|nr:PAS domain S-box protein [Planctomycetota bacterium]